MAGGATQTAGAYLASDYSVHGGGQKDEAPKLRNLLGIVAAAGGGTIQFVSGLTYLIGSTVAIPPSTNGIELSIPTGTTLQGMPGLIGDVLTGTAAGLRISGGGTIDANRAAGSQGNCVTLTSCFEPQVEEISLINAYADGLALVNCVRPVVDVFAGANGRHGVYHSGTAFGRGQVSVRDNGQRVAGSGLVFDATSTDNTYAPVVATDSRAGGAKTQLYGVLEVAASGCDRNVVAAASLGGNATGTVSLVGVSSGLQAGAPVGPAGGQLGGNYPNPSIAGPVADAALAGYPWTNGDLAPAAAIASSKLAGYPWHNADLAADVARANQLVNGGFEIWQRGNGPFVGGIYSADRWFGSSIGTDVISVSRDTANRDVGSSACLACTFTLGTGAGTSSIFNLLSLTTDYTQIVGRTLSLSVRVKTNVANAVRVAVYNGAAWAYSAFHTGGGAYETLTVASVVVGAAATQAMAGLFFAATCVAYFDNASLVIGAVPCDYVPLPPADDLTRCQRYYEPLSMLSDGTLMVAGYQLAGSAVFQTFAYKVQKPVAPTVTKIGTWSLANAAGQPTINQFGVLSTLMQIVTVAAAGASAQNGAGCTITVEANP